MSESLDSEWTLVATKRSQNLKLESSVLIFLVFLSFKLDHRKLTS